MTKSGKTRVTNAEASLAQISRGQWRETLELARQARAKLLADAEGFSEAARILEQIGRSLSRTVGEGLGSYDALFLELMESEIGDRDRLKRLIVRVREARNATVHHGAMARKFASELNQLLLLIESACMNELTTVEEIMVWHPTVAENWHKVADVRAVLLSSSFSTLPYRHMGEWMLIVDYNLLAFLRPARKERGKLTVAKALKEGLILVPARVTNPGALASQLELDHFPTLVAVNDSLVGIVAAFDLL